MTQHQQTEFATFLLRVALGIMYLAHSIVLKLSTYGLAGTASFFVGVGLPGWLAYVTFAAEVVGGVLLILGVQTRWVVLALMPALLGAIIWVHAGNGWVFTAPNGGWEYPAFLIVVSIVSSCSATALMLSHHQGPLVSPRNRVRRKPGRFPLTASSRSSEVRLTAALQLRLR